MKAPKSLAQILTQVNLPSPLPKLLFKFTQSKSTQNSGQSAFKDRINTSSSLLSERSQNKWANIDNFDEFPSLSPASVKKSLPLIEWSERRSQQKRLVLSNDDDNSAPSTVTRARREITTKSFKQTKLKSQERRDTAIKAQRAARRRDAKARKEAKLMKPRKEDVSQLINRLRSSSL